MAYTAVDIVNLQDCIRDLKELEKKIGQAFDEYSAVLCRFEGFINRYIDIEYEEDLPL